MAKYFASSTAKQRIAVAVSGGVDSSVAAFLLHRFNQSKSPGADIVGLYMNNWNINEEQHKIKTNAGCARYEKDVQDARAVCKTIGLKMHEVSFESEYWTDVFQPFVEVGGFLLAVFIRAYKKTMYISMILHDSSLFLN